MSEAISQAQQDAIDKAYDILAEHFESSLICVETSLDDTDNTDIQKTCFMFYFHGGRSAAIGMANRAAHKITAHDSSDE